MIAKFAPWNSVRGGTEVVHQFEINATNRSTLTVFGVNRYMKLKLIRNFIESDINAFRKIVLLSHNMTEICDIYDLPRNGKSTSYLWGLIRENDIPTGHFILQFNNIKYPRVEKECPQCKRKFITKQGEPREKFTCSYECSAKYFDYKRHSEEAKEKMRQTFLKKNFERGIIKKIISIKKSEKQWVKRIQIEFKCPVCRKIFYSTNPKRKTCSKSCFCKIRIITEKTRKKLSQAAIKRIKNGTFSGWKSRVDKKPSYPEKFFMEVLKNNNIKYEREKPCGIYFIDFAIISPNGTKIAFEVDGKQHKYLERKIKDNEKDLFLNKNGWIPYRLAWNYINSPSGKILMKEKIDNFLEFYNGGYGKSEPACLGSRMSA